MASIKKRDDGGYRARYRDESGKEHARHFRRQADAQRWLDEVTASIVTGQYGDPKAGKETVKQYAERWRNVQDHRPGTAALYERVLRLHVYPFLGDLPLRSVRHSHLRAFLSGLERTERRKKAQPQPQPTVDGATVVTAPKPLAPNTARQVHAITRAGLRVGGSGPADPVDAVREDHLAGGAAR